MSLAACPVKVSRLGWCSTEIAEKVAGQVAWLATNLCQRGCATGKAIFQKVFILLQLQKILDAVNQFRLLLIVLQQVSQVIALIAEQAQL